VIYDLPPVGGNLHDHPEVLVQNWCETQVSLYRASKGWRQLATGLKWFAAKRGLAASSQFHAAAFIRTGAGVLRPDVKLELFPLAYGPDLKPLTGDAYQIHVGLMRPSSRGSLSIRSADPSESPSIRFNFLEHPADTLALTRAIRLVREILAQAPIARFTGAEISPGRDVQTDEQIFRWMRRTLRGAYHPVGTCRMGAANDPDAVVDPRLRVRGVEALRVVDASVMPRITTGNTNAPTIMIAEKAADMILSRSAPSKIPAPFWTNPDWKTRQR
jgi:choline dehydrogenase